MHCLPEHSVVGCFNVGYGVQLQQLPPKIPKCFKTEELLVLNGVPCVNVPIDFTISRIEAIDRRPLKHEGTDNTLVSKGYLQPCGC